MAFEDLVGTESAEIMLNQLELAIAINDKKKQEGIN
jgi:hypothetical protein